MIYLFVSTALAVDDTYWNTFPITVSYQDSNFRPDNLSEANVAYALSSSLTAWRVPDTDLDFEFKMNDSNAYGIISFAEELPDDRLDSLGVTKTFYNSEGRIYSFTIELDSNVNWGTRGEEDLIDLQSCITHEIGHAIGFHHSEEEDSTMFFSMSEGEMNKRDLSNSDKQMVVDKYGTNFCGSQFLSLLFLPISSFYRLLRKKSNAKNGLKFYLYDDQK